LISPPSHPRFAASVRCAVDAECADLVIPSSDADVAALSRGRRLIGDRLFLPSRSVIARCQDKLDLALFLRARGIPVPLTYPISDLARIEAVFRRLPRAERLWCRMRTGTDSKGATPVRRPDQARSWISYWEEMRGVPPGSFTLSEY